MRGLARSRFARPGDRAALVIRADRSRAAHSADRRRSPSTTLTTTATTRETSRKAISRSKVSIGPCFGRSRRWRGWVDRTPLAPAGLRCGLVGSGGGVAACIRLPVDPNSPRVARLFVADCLRRWGYDSLVREAELLTSEIVTNAVLHAAQEPVVVELDDLADGAVIVVGDPVDDLLLPVTEGARSAGRRWARAADRPPARHRRGASSRSRRRQARVVHPHHLLTSRRVPI